MSGRRGGARVERMSDAAADGGAQRSDLIGRLRRAAPGPIKAALRPVMGTRSAGAEQAAVVRAEVARGEVARAGHVASTTPDGAESPRSHRRYRLADQWVGDRYTVQAGPRTHRFFFITGCYKSGTNWAQNILNLHPAVNCKGEFHFEALLKGFDEFTTVPWYLSSKPRMSRVARDSFEDVVRRMIYVKTRDKPEAQWLGDRTPRAMVELLPGAPIVNMIRDGRDVLVSWNFHHLRVKSADRVWPGARKLAERIVPEFRADPESFEQRGKGFLFDEAWFRAHAQLWARIVLHDLEAAPRLSEGGTRVLAWKYEDMHRDVGAARRALFELLELDEARAAPLSRESKTVPGVESPSPTKFMRKGAVGDWKNYFDERLTRWFKEEAGGALVRAGYEAGDGWC